MPEFRESETRLALDKLKEVTDRKWHATIIPGDNSTYLQVKDLKFIYRCKTRKEMNRVVECLKKAGATHVNYKWQETTSIDGIPNEGYYRVTLTPYQVWWRILGDSERLGFQTGIL